MKYESPKINNQPYYVPIVIKNKDMLVGYINGMNFFKRMMTHSLSSAGLSADFSGIELCLESTRFNDILENGKNLWDLSDDEYDKFVEEKVRIKMERAQNPHPDNILESSPFLIVDCMCGFGYYSFATSDKIPEDGFSCVECGKKLIDFTGYSDDEYEINR